MIAFFLYMIVLLLLGHAVLAQVGGPARRAFGEWLGLSLGLGIAVAGIVFVLLSIAGVLPSKSVVLELGIAALILSLLAWDSRPQLPANAKPLPGWALLSAGACIITAYAMEFGNFEWDAYMLWGMKARIVAYAPLTEATTIWDPHYTALHPNYPLHFPFVMAGLYNLSNGVGDVIPKLLMPAYWLAMALLLAATLRQRREQAVLLVAWALLAPSVLRWTASGYADVPLAALHAGALFCLLRWIDHDDPRALWLLAIFAIALVGTKNEGTPMAAVMLVIVAVYTFCNNRSWRPFFTCLGIMVLLLLPWILFRNTLPVWDENYPGHLRATHFQDNLARIPIIVKGFCSRTLASPQWNGLWHVLILLVILAPKRACEPRTLVLWAVLLGQVGAYSVAYLIGPIDPADLLTTTGDRLLNHLLPVTLLVIGQLLPGAPEPTFRPLPKPAD
jgi:hypothetical protein